jgi:hypothetical protein
MAKNTIMLKNYLNVFEEYKAVTATIYPGCLVELTSAEKVKLHATAGGNALPMFAIEDALQGKGIDDAFAADDTVRCWIPTRGDVVYGILADGQTIVKGEFVESNGAGYLRKHTPEEDSGGTGTPIYTRNIVGISLDTESAAAGSEDSDINFLSLNRRIAVRII